MSEARLALSIGEFLLTCGPRAASVFVLAESWIEKRSPTWSSTRVDMIEEKFKMKEMKYGDEPWKFFKAIFCIYIKQYQLLSTGSRAGKCKIQNQFPIISFIASASDFPALYVAPPQVSFVTFPTWVWMFKIMINILRKLKYTIPSALLCLFFLREFQILNPQQIQRYEIAQEDRIYAEMKSGLSNLTSTTNTV